LYLLPLSLPFASFLLQMKLADIPIAVARPLNVKPGMLSRSDSSSRQDSCQGYEDGATVCPPLDAKAVLP
jgi:hypothetical protein